MGDETEDSINHLLSNMDEVLSEFLPAWIKFNFL
jgi:hypothetical protein